MRKILALILAVLMLSPLTGCRPITGSCPELFVVATHSLLGVLGRDREDVLVLAEDDFGRVMFAYTGNTITGDRGDIFNILAVLVAQRTTRSYAYFYDGFNYVLTALDRPELRQISDFFDEIFVMEYFSEEQLEQLKAENNWNKELNEDRFFRVQVSRRYKTNYMTYVSRETQEEVLLAVSGGFRNSHSIPLTTDKNGNVLYLIRGAGTFLFMFDSDGNLIEETGIMELSDENLWDYRDQLREFKEANGWAFYYRETEED